jgi:MFS family permease
MLTGLGWGAVEAASNPMVAAVYPEEKTHRLNILHAWWPAGIVVGGLVGVGISAFSMPWQLNLLILIVPSLLLAYLVISTEFPVTERVANGVSHKAMYAELLRSPSILLWCICMMLTASAELAPGQWVELALSKIVGMKGILLLVYVSLLMFVMRHFAGTLTRWISPIGLLWSGSLLAAAGLYGLSVSTTPIMAFACATVWGMGVCYMWPTMLATVNERYPKGGAFFMGLMGFAAGLATQFVLPKMGAIFDRAKIEAAGGLDKLEGMSASELEDILKFAAEESFRAVSVVPLLLLPIFGAIWFYDRRKAKLNS